MTAWHHHADERLVVLAMAKTLILNRLGPPATFASCIVLLTYQEAPNVKQSYRMQLIQAIGEFLPRSFFPSFPVRDGFVAL